MILRMGGIAVASSIACQQTFEMTDSIKLGTLESATSIANEQCGWKISR